MASQKLIVGNWKMNGLQDDARARISAVLDYAPKAPSSAKVVLCPPVILLNSAVSQTASSSVAIGAQDCHAEKSGAYTGNTSAEMLKDAGCRYVIVGHSERRQYHKESSEDVAAKAKAAHEQNLIAIICVGETDAERSAGTQEEIVLEQLQKSIPAGSTAENTVIAYEPVWAIGTGKTATVQDVADMHRFIRGHVSAMPILYGGSVKSSNAQEILHTENVDGVLVGGASLKADEFIGIISAS